MKYSKKKEVLIIMAIKAIQKGGKITLQKDYKLVSDVLDQLVETYPDKGATYIAPTGEEIFVSYADMKKTALKYLAALQSNGVKAGDILIVETEEPRFFHFMLWACMYGGIIISPINTPASWDLKSESLNIFLKQLQHLNNPIVVTQKTHEPFYEEVKKSVDSLNYLVIEDLQSDVEGVCEEQSEDDVIYIQFSSGTTGTPQGVLLTHKNIVFSCLATSEILALKENEDAFSWLPHTHNLGVFVPVIASMMMLNSGYFMTPATFLRNPALFLKKISEHKGGWFCINNFGLEWMIRQVPEEAIKDIDISSLISIFPGAENISNSTITRFVEKFGKYGLRREVIRPGYGLSEATLVLSVTRRYDGPVIEYISRKDMLKNNKAVPVEDINSPDCVCYTGNGVPIKELELRIVDDDGNILNEGDIGEVQAFGTSVFQGYYNDPEKTNERKKDGWLCTGDLGYLSNGQLFIVGRKKDIVIIRGVNYILTDIENVICSCAEIPKGIVAATGVMQNQEETLAVFVEYKEDINNFTDTYKRVVSAVREQFGINLQLVIPIPAIPKTASGKIKRFLLKMQYESGEYNEICTKLNELLGIKNDEINDCGAKTEMEILVAKCWSEVLNIDFNKLSLDDIFWSLGGESVQAYKLVELLSQRLNMNIEHEIVVKCKTISEMVNYLEEEKERLATIKEEEEEEAVRKSEEIAITGIGFRLPDANNQDEFWDNLCKGRDSIARVSDERKKLANAPNWNDWLGEVKDIDKFDYEFFDIDYDEAVFMDPQHRLAMEVAYEALEDAGMVVNDDTAKKIGVFTAVLTNSYFPIVSDYIDKNGSENIHPKAMINNMNNIMAARISHQYNFTGPVMAIDTACSSFFAALHTARNTIINDEADGAVVMGTNILSTHYVCELAKKAGIISSTNMSKVFDINADGSILGEGVIVIYIERLSTAIKNNKNIYGVIHSTAINNDGFALGIMSPNPKGEFDVLKEAYDKSNISPKDISYFEAHGTGTAIGDPIEINALSRLFEKHTENDDDKIAIGSVKTNIGHLLPAAGGAGILKVLMCLKNKQLVPSIHMENINPLLEIDKTPFRVILDNEEWKPRNGKERIAGISSLGLGGTNAHIIVGEDVSEYNVPIHRNHVLTISAKSQEALDKIEKATIGILEKAEVNTSDLCMTRNRYRKHYKYRAACVVDGDGNIISEMIKGNAIKSVPNKVSVYLGDLCKEGSYNEFKQLYDKLKLYKKLIKGFVKFYGKGSGKLVAELLEGNIDFNKAEELYKNLDNYNQEPEFEKNFDVLLKIGTQKEEPFANEDINVVDGIFMEDNIDILFNLQKLYVMGTEINWQILYPNGAGRIVSLPAYPFADNSVWLK